MAVAHLRVGHPPAQQRAPAGQVPSDQLLDAGRHGRIQHLADKGLHLGKVLLPMRQDGFRAACLADRLGPLTAGVKRSQQVSDAAQLGVHVGPAAHQARQAPVIGQAAHDDQVVAGFPAHRHVGDAQVHVGSEPSVELDLPMTGLFPGHAGREVQEAHADRLLHLVDTIADEEQRRNVRLDQPALPGHHLSFTPSRSRTPEAKVHRPEPVTARRDQSPRPIRPTTLSSVPAESS